MGPIFLSPGDLVAQLHPGFGGLTEFDTNPKSRFLSFKITPSNDRGQGGYALSGYSTREQVARGHFFEGMQSSMENKNEENENKIILGDFNFAMDEMDRYGGNKTQGLYRCCSNKALSKLFVDNGLQGQWRWEKPDPLEPTRYDRSFGKDPA